MIVALQLVSIQTLEKHLTTTRSINERTLKSSELNYSPSPDQGEFETMTITTANRADQTNGQPAPTNQEEDTTYNGWTNYETWNVALWINNDQGLYSIAREHSNYQSFVEALRDLTDTDRISVETPDEVAWNDSGINIAELNELFVELFDPESH